ncbi:MAG: hypothetical protein ABGZ53_32995, partial [Fuerstiella sp.]
MTTSSFVARIRRLFSSKKSVAQKRIRHLRLLQLEDRRVLNASFALTGLDLTLDSFDVGDGNLSISMGTASIDGANVDAFVFALDANTWDTDPGLPADGLEVSGTELRVAQSLFEAPPGASVDIIVSDSNNVSVDITLLTQVETFGGNFQATTDGNFGSGVGDDLLTSGNEANEDSGSVTITAGLNVTLLGDIDTSGFDNVANAADSDAGAVTINTLNGNITTAAISAVGGDTDDADLLPNGEGGVVTLHAVDGDASGTDGDVTVDGDINTSTELAATTNVNIDAYRDAHINAPITTLGGYVDVDAGRDILSAAAGDITTTGDKANEDSGDVTMDAGRNVNLQGFVDTRGIDNAAPGKGGDITIRSHDGNITTQAGATLNAEGGDSAADGIPDDEGGVITLDAQTPITNVTFDGAGGVDDALEQITWAAHDLQTGDLVVYNDGGGTTIGGLTSTNTYAVIVVDANTIQLALNQANALTSGTAIDLTDGAGAAHTLTTTRAAASDVTIGDTIMTSTETGVLNVDIDARRNVAINAAITTRGGHVDVNAGGDIDSAAAGDITTTGDRINEASGDVTMDAGLGVDLDGDITTDGFTNTTDAQDSDAGTVTINAANGDITTAAISAVGGATTNAAIMGEGGVVTLNADDGDASGNDGSVTVAGAINTSTELAAPVKVDIDADLDVNINQPVTTRGGSVDVLAGQDIISGADGDITTTGDKPNEASGNVTMNAGRNVTLAGFVDTSGIDNAGPGTGGAITITTVSGNITTQAGATLDARGGDADAVPDGVPDVEGGTITLDANDAGAGVQDNVGDITVGAAIDTSTELATPIRVILNAEEDVNINAAVTTRGASVDVDATENITSDANGDITTTGDRINEDSGDVTMDAGLGVALDGDITTDGFTNTTDAQDSDAGTVTINAANGDITTAAISAVGGAT